LEGKEIAFAFEKDKHDLYGFCPSHFRASVQQYLPNPVHFFKAWRLFGLSGYKALPKEESGFQQCIAKNLAMMSVPLTNASVKT
jgi:hypothetical protein